MRHVTLFTLLFALWIGGCSSAPEVVEAPEPDEFTTIMYEIAAELGGVDRHLIGGRYAQAAAQCRTVHRQVRELANFERSQNGNRFVQYAEYSAQVSDLLHATDRLLYMLEQRRHADAEDMLAAVAMRYNRLSRNYGPSEQVGVLGQSAEAFQFYAASPADVRDSR